MKLKEYKSWLNEEIPERNLEILIQGLAVSNFDTDSKKWKVFFPKVESHDFRIDIRIIKTINASTKKVYRNSFTVPVASKIELVNDGAKGSGSYDRELIKDTIDISELHGEAVHLVNDRNKYAAFLLLNQATVGTETESEKPTYDIWRVKPSTNPEKKEKIDRKTIGTANSCGFNLPENSKTEIIIGSELNHSIVLTHKKDIQYVVSFENDCKKGFCTESDFKYYYRVIDMDKFSIDQKFEFIRYTDPTIKAAQTMCDTSGSNGLVVPDGLIP